MALVVEDGTGKSDAESYVSVSACADYAAKVGGAFATTDTTACEAALRRATAWVDGTYSHRFPGVRSKVRNQALEWPRIDAEDREGYAIGPTEVPREIVSATCEAAIRELATPGTMAPDLERGGAIRKMQAGSVALEYAAAAPVTPMYLVIDNLLSPILRSGNKLVGRAVRG